MKNRFEILLSISYSFLGILIRSYFEIKERIKNEKESRSRGTPTASLKTRPLRNLFMKNQAGGIIKKYFMVLICLWGIFLFGCENTDIQTATDAGLDAVKALTLSEKEILELAEQSARYSDQKHNLAAPDNKYALRLGRIVGSDEKDGNLTFNFGVYLSSQVNAFAMASGTIRLYSGLMDKLDDHELQFVIGHEMGHVAKNHIRKKIRMALATSAVRKGIASQKNLAGDVARSLLGDLAESLMNAQFSQLEEKEADDYGLEFLKRKKENPRHAVSALKKIAKLGPDHSFLSSHPDPDKRAERLQAQLEGKAVSIEENRQNVLSRIKTFLETRFPSIFKFFERFFPWPTKKQHPISNLFQDILFSV